MDPLHESQVHNQAMDSQTRHHPEETMGSLRESIAQFEQQKLVRSVQEAKLGLAKELIEIEAWDDALRILRPLWQTMTYRNEGWWDIVEEVAYALRNVAARTGDGGTIVSVDWELMNSSE
jgi:hypothetical protein